MSAYWKIPLQALVLIVGVLMFVFYVFIPSPMLFNTVHERAMREGPRAAEYSALERRHEEITASRAAAAAGIVRAESADDSQMLEVANREFKAREAEARDVRAPGLDDGGNRFGASHPPSRGAAR